MPNLNKIEVIGRLGTEPELRFTPRGKPVINFTVAVNEYFTNSDGEKKENTEWFTIVAWNKLAENCNQFLAKSHHVFVSGKIRLHKWTNKDNGQQRSRNEIHANQVIFLEKKSDNEAKPDEMPKDEIPY